MTMRWIPFPKGIGATWQRPKDQPDLRGIGVYEDAKGAWHWFCDSCQRLSAGFRDKGGSQTALDAHWAEDGHTWRHEENDEVLAKVEM